MHRLLLDAVDERRLGDAGTPRIVGATSIT
jgi:hypothetical protein